MISIEKAILLLAALLGFHKSLSQFPNVLISTLRDPEEVSISINPKNTNQIVAGSNLANTYRSYDAGATWTTGLLTCSQYSVYGDPVVIWDTANACYYLHLSDPNSAVTPGGSWIDRIVVQRSTDFGQNYTSCTGIGKNGTKAQDKPWVVVDPANNALHVTWTQFDNYGSSAAIDSSVILYSKSTDGGTTWATPKRISHYAGDCIDSDNTVEGAVPAIGPAGEVYVAWAGPKGLVFQKSTDGGTTWLPTEKILESIPGGWDYDVSGIFRANGLPFTFCDLSNSPYKGSIYINWSDHRNGATDGDVWVIKSSDAGNTWGAPVRVNDDVPGKEQFMSSMTIDQATGYVYVLFYDRRNFTGNANTDVYMGVSKDGGATFTNYKINSNTFTPSASVFFGDYIAISAHNNIVRPMWMQLSNYTLSVYTALINPSTVNIYETLPETLTVYTPHPNPFSTETTVEFSLAENLNLEIQLVNNEGRLLKNLRNEKQFGYGKNLLTINKNKLGLSPGIYYLVFYGDEKSKYVKLIVE
jgi:hypothetical protein